MNLIDKTQKDWHTKWYRDLLSEGIEKYGGHMDPDDMGYWSQIYCLYSISDFFINIPKSTFLTVGDGYCGREGGLVHRFGHFVHASDWEPCLIEVAKDRGLVDECSKQDLNQLTFEDDSFDFVLGKETLHHMSMPYKGLYEMLRVAKKGVILLEPSGEIVPKNKHNDFEPTGNYVFTFTAHELLHVGLAYGLRSFVYTYSTVFYGPFTSNSQEERHRLIAIDSVKKLEDKNIIIFFFLKDENIFNTIHEGNKYKKIKVIGSSRNW